MVQVVREAHDRAPQFVLHALERFEIIPAQRRKEALDLGDALAHLLEVFVLDVEKGFLAVEQQRLDAAHLVVEPLPELNEVDAATFGKEARLQEILAEVAEELAVIRAVELLVRQVPDVPDPEANDVVPRAAELSEDLLEHLERDLCERLRLREGARQHGGA